MPVAVCRYWGLGTGVEVVLYAALDVVGCVCFHLGIGVGLGHALAVELQPGEAAVDVGEVAVGLVGVERNEGLEVFERGLVVGGGLVAKAGGVVEGSPGGGVEARLIDDDGRWGGGDGVALVVAMANDVVEEEADDDGEQDVVAGAKLHGRPSGCGRLDIARGI
jgi:hypothetical protein